MRDVDHISPGLSYAGPYGVSHLPVRSQLPLGLWCEGYLGTVEWRSGDGV